MEINLVSNKKFNLTTPKNRKHIIFFLSILLQITNMRQSWCLN